MRKKEGILLCLVILIIVLGLTGRYSNILGIIQQNTSDSGDVSGSKVISEVVVPAASAAEASQVEKQVDYEQLQSLSYEHADIDFWIRKNSRFMLKFWAHWILWRRMWCSHPMMWIR